MSKYRADIDDAEIIELRDQGFLLREVAVRLGCSLYTVSVRERAARALDFGNITSAADRPDDLLTWAELRDKYGSLRAVGAAVGKSHEYVRQQLLHEQGG